MMTRRQSTALDAVRGRVCRPARARDRAAGRRSCSTRARARRRRRRAPPSPDKAQYVIFSTSGNGDPINANVPGHVRRPEDRPQPRSRDGADAADARGPNLHGGGAVGHAAAERARPHVLLAPDDEHAGAPQGAGRAQADGRDRTAARCSRRCSPGSWRRASAPSRRSRSASARRRPSEGLSFGGAALPIIPALALKATLTNAAGPLTNLQPLRDQTLNQLYDLYKNGATPAQRAYIDSLVTSQQQVRSINQDLLDALTSITDNSAGVADRSPRSRSSR